MIKRNLAKLSKKIQSNVWLMLQKTMKVVLNHKIRGKISSNGLPGPCKATGIAGTIVGIPLVGQK